MKVNLVIEEDPQFRAHVKELIGGQVRAILRDQLSGIVAGEIAKLRLLQPGDTTLSDMIQKQVQNTITSEVRRLNLDKLIRDRIHDEVARAVAGHVATIKASVVQVVRETFK